MSDREPLVRSAVAAGVATLTLDSPDTRNALSSVMITDLIAAIETAIADDRVRVIVLTHAGSAFCAGADLKETAAAFSTGAVPVARMGELLAAVWESTKPVVARVGGAARAGGLGLVAAADIAVCSTAASFSFSEVRLGVVPAVISATVLPRLAPRAAAELFLTGETFDGTRAAAIGLVTSAVPAEMLDETVAGYTRSLLRGAPGALAGAKALTRRRPSEAIRDDLVELTELSVRYFTSPEGREGVMSFLEKRDPSWIVRR